MLASVVKFHNADVSDRALDLAERLVDLTLSTADRHPILQFSAGALKFLCDEFFVWKDSLILRGENLVGEIVECVVGFCCSLLGTQNESDWRVLAGLHPVLAGVIQIEVHLPSVRITELPYLDVNDDQPVQTTVEENEVDTKPVVVDAKPALAAEESKIIAQLQKKVGETVDERLFEI